MRPRLRYAAGIAHGMMDLRGRTLISLALGASLLAASPAARSAEIDIKIGDCKSGVRVVARDAPLSAVLERMAEALGFQFEQETSADRIVNVTLAGSASDVITRLLASHERFMMSHARDQRCPGQSRVSRVWLLPNGQPNSATAKTPATAPKPVTKPVPVTLTASPEHLRAAEESARQLKQDYDAYVNRHGKPPPGEEEEAARP